MANRIASHTEHAHRRSSGHARLQPALTDPADRSSCFPTLNTRFRSFVMSSSGEREVVGNIEPSGTAAEEDQEPKYCVELILDKRLYNNKVEYFLKWKGYDVKDNCIRKEKQRKKRAILKCVGSGVKRIRSNSTTTCASSDAHCVSAVIEPEKKDIEKKVEVHDVSNVFEKIPDRILGASNSTGPLMFLMKWKGVEEVDLILAEKANLMCPQLVIKFYESININGV